MTPPVLSVENLVKHFPVRRGLFGTSKSVVRAVDGVSFDLAAGETLGLVGESGCGKSTLIRSLLGLTPLTSGVVRLDGKNITNIRGADFRRQRRELQIIFQDPYSALDPRQTVGSAIAEGLRVHNIVSKDQVRDEVRRLLTVVGLEVSSAERFPHAFSGGQRQRICIARALAVRPRVLMADEPVASLDVSVQAQIVNLLSDLREQYGLSYVFVSHDIRVVRQISRRIAVMYLGRLVELGTADDVCARPKHPYTEALLSAVPRIREDRQGARLLLEGDPPDPAQMPRGCAFHPRCRQVMDQCRQEEPVWTDLGGGQHFRCHLPKKQTNS
jgi:oligopeptide/dipeptide ABC transporter ATP-binding protein